MEPNDRARWVGSVALSPDDRVPAGTVGTWTLALTVGEWGIDATGAVRLAVRNTTDWQAPQFDRSDGDAYCRVATDGRARLVPRFDPHGGERPWARIIEIRVLDGWLAAGDHIWIVLGDPSAGSVGIRAQSFPESPFEFRVSVDSHATGRFYPVAEQPFLDIVPGSAEQLTVVAPSEVRLGDQLTATVRLEDAWGNVIQLIDDAQLSLVHHQMNDGDGIDASDGKLRVDKPGTYKVRASAEGFAALSNPVVVREEQPNDILVWGDTQGQSGGTVGIGTLDDFYRYARDLGCLDFMVHSGNDFQITGAMWAESEATTNAFYEPGRFVPFISYEWSGNPSTGGDCNVVYRGASGPLYRSSHALIDDDDVDTDRCPLDTLWRTFDERDDVFAIPHIGGRRTNLDFASAVHNPLIEICSTHGHFEWLYREALDRGLAVGVAGASDDHSGRPGASRAANNNLRAQQGFTAVRAAARTREAIFDALRARRTYATTGPRIWIDYECAGVPLGGEIEIRDDVPQPLTMRVAAAQAIERVELYRNGELVDRTEVAARGAALRLRWSGARHDTRARIADWSGGCWLSEGRIEHARDWGDGRPSEGATQVDDRYVAWRSSTVGNAQGVVLRLAAQGDARLWISAGPGTLSVSVNEAFAGRQLDLGGQELELVAERAPAEDGPQSYEKSWNLGSDRLPLLPGAYWVKVVQVDGAIAWTSPIFMRQS